MRYSSLFALLGGVFALLRGHVPSAPRPARRVGRPVPGTDRGGAPWMVNRIVTTLDLHTARDSGNATGSRPRFNNVHQVAGPRLGSLTEAIRKTPGIDGVPVDLFPGQAQRRYRSARRRRPMPVTVRPASAPVIRPSRSVVASAVAVSVATTLATLLSLRRRRSGL